MYRPPQTKVKVGVTSVNQGWVTGHKNYLQIEGLTRQDILGNFITQKYLNDKDCPDFLVLNQKLENKLYWKKPYLLSFLVKYRSSLNLEKKIEVSWMHVKQTLNIF